MSSKTDSQIMAEHVMKLFGVLMLSCMAVKILDTLSPTMIPPFEITYGPVAIQLNWFLVEAFVFSFAMSGRMRKWMNDYSIATTNQLPASVTGCFYFSELLLILSPVMPQIWPSMIAMLLITIMTMNARCRTSMISKQKELQWTKSDKKMLATSILYSLAVTAIIFCLLFFKLGKSKYILEWRYIAMLPPLLLIVPRFLMGSKDVREEKDIAEALKSKDIPESLRGYVWFIVFSLWIFIASTVQIGIFLLFSELSGIRAAGHMWFDDKGHFLLPVCAGHVSFVIGGIGVIALGAYFMVFPLPDSKTTSS